MTDTVSAHTVTSACRSHGRVRLDPAVAMTKDEVFVACQVLADAGRCLVRTGHLSEADALGDLFELFESRLFAVDR